MLNFEYENLSELSDSSSSFSSDEESAYESGYTGDSPSIDSSNQSLSDEVEERHVLLDETNLQRLWRERFIMNDDDGQPFYDEWMRSRPLLCEDSVPYSSRHQLDLDNYDVICSIDMCVNALGLDFSLSTSGQNPVKTPLDAFAEDAGMVWLKIGASTCVLRLLLFRYQVVPFKNAFSADLDAARIVHVMNYDKDFVFLSNRMTLDSHMFCVFLQKYYVSGILVPKTNLLRITHYGQKTPMNIILGIIPGYPSFPMGDCFLNRVPVDNSFCPVNGLNGNSYDIGFKIAANQIICSKRLSAEYLVIHSKHPILFD